MEAAALKVCVCVCVPGGGPVFPAGSGLGPDVPTDVSGLQ